MPCCSLQKNTRKRRRNLVFSNSIHSGRECSRSRVSSRNGRWFALVVVVVLVVNQASELASGFDMNIRQSISRSAGTTPHSARWRRTTLQLRVVEVDTLSPTMIKEAEKEETIRLPPWLATQRSSATNTLQQQQEQLQEELQWLQWTLMDRRLSEELVEEILQAIRVACRGNIEWMLGCVDFLQTLLRLEQVATPTVVLASIVHYVECAAARTDGVYSYDTVQQRLTLGDSLERVSGHRLALPPSSVLEGRSETHTETRFDSISQSAKARRKQKRGSSSLKHKENRIPSSPIQDGMSFSSFLSGSLTSEILHISNGASQIKRAEIVAEVVLPRQADYEKVQNLLVSVSGDDWRALAIRCVASLHRLEGGTIQASTHLYQNEDRHPQMIATARNAIHVYAPLAQRMGLHVLKTQLESKAFSILYPRQYKAALALFDRQGDSMQAVSRYLQQQITQLLQQDPNLGTTDIQVTARVKEPYSFWKKLLRKNRSTTNHMGRSMILRFDAELSRRELASILQVRDGVALRVIVQAPPLDRDDESLEESRARDQLVCYYVHQLIRAVFPETDPSGVKDYIQSPKANGYQSLHHTSVIRRDTLEIPFEVQG
jgi:ppGpp synthetase/RelA/SpoT-type nucleotidyltranferase